MKVSLYEAPHPLQPLLLQPNGERKFHPNAIVVALVADHGVAPLSLLQDPAYSLEDRAQLAQLLGAFEHELDDWGLSSALPVKRRARRTGAKAPLQPIQPVVLDPKGVPRFKTNRLVEFLTDDAARRNGLDLNQIALKVSSGEFSIDDSHQLDQMNGYSLSGAPVSKRILNAADREWDERHERVARQDIEERFEQLDGALPAAVVAKPTKPRF